jgi:hypothetical protein
MLTLGAIQASTWGYSIRVNPAGGGLTGGGGSLPTFTRPVMGFDGCLYAIASSGGTSQGPKINGVTQPNLIIKITPGTSNTATTNWTAGTITYLIPDANYLTRDDGFGKPTWTVSTENASINYNSGVLASNGLIYFSPILGANFVIFNPALGLWKTSNIHPDRVDSTTTLAGKIHSCVLGGDNKIYVIPTSGNKLYRIVTSTNALNDTWEQGYHTTTPTGLFNAAMTYYDNTGTLQTDTSTTGAGNAGIFYQAYYKSGGTTGASYMANITDAIYHPSGRIYIIPNLGRGRIFYINTDDTNWNTNKQVVSDAGLVVKNSSGVKQIPLFAYAFLEKPRDAAHASYPGNNTLKIYLMPNCGSQSATAPQTYYSNGNNYELIYIDPVTNTLHEIPMNFKYANSGNQYQVSKRVSLANGLNITTNLAGTTDHKGGAVLTGWDIPSSDTDGAYTIKRNAVRNDNIPISGIFTDQYTGPGGANVFNSEPGFAAGFGGGGFNMPYPNHSKFIMLTGQNVGTAGIAEIISVKEYGPEITNFNYTNREKTGAIYEPPSDPQLLGNSLFNSGFNKQK